MTAAPRLPRGPLSPSELPRVTDRRAVAGGAIVPVPENNAYGPLRVLERTDGLFVVFDTRCLDVRRPLDVEHQVFWNEADARAWAVDHA